MSSLLHLPKEILVQICHNLGSIDDVHHFSRACKKTHDAINPPSIYVDVMRSIIGSATQHRYDIFLCTMLKIHRIIVEHYPQDNPPAPHIMPTGPDSFDTQLLAFIVDECPSGPCTRCLPDDRIYEILARYQGCRVLEDEWLKRPLDRHDLLPVKYGMESDEFMIRYQVLKGRHPDFSHGAGSADKSFQAKYYTYLDIDQRGRFYAALTSVWTLNELRWLFTQFPYLSLPEHLDFLDSCMIALEEKVRETLVDEADRYAMWQFLYQHILPLYGCFLADQDCAELPLTFPSDLAEHSAHGARILQLFLLAGQTYLQPPDLIDLILRYRTSREAPYPRLEIPQSTKLYQRPSQKHPFPPGTDYSDRVARFFRESTALDHLRIISLATFYQSKELPFTHAADYRQGLLHPLLLFNIRDESGAYFHDMITWKYAWVMNRTCCRRHDPEERLGKIKSTFDTQWRKVWWEVWWWANSEDKAVSKIERWVPLEGDCIEPFENEEVS